MNIDKIRLERLKWHEWKNIKSLRNALEKLPFIDDAKVKLEDTIQISSKNITEKEKETIKNLAWDLRPWRKGPFELFDTFIDSEWKSYIKYNLLEPHFNLKDKCVADVGCNNGYYLFKMLKHKPKKLVGFDPSIHYKTQFDFINHFVNSPIKFELLGIEHLPYFENRFDFIFCLGVLYHRSDPIAALKSLKRSLRRGGELILDTFMIDGDEPLCLVPEPSYSKIKNVHFVPTVSALENWCKKGGFERFEVLKIVKTTSHEQRSTEWMEGESLENFLDPQDSSLTIEGYPAPKRVYIRAYRK
ncbi:MAG: tRNA 5-methoxyuridine(34)/uridine 5-oxyacetic acid(34) synthase CmoB [Campylobacteraceae bacterium]|nr:tRNA 5-methoxyuridine(34)/uridine 5-oxyacetic acid(34) synthase CmoB [Campylobacteraceae bacterium]